QRDSLAQRDFAGDRAGDQLARAGAASWGRRALAPEGLAERVRELFGRDQLAAFVQGLESLFLFVPADHQYRPPRPWIEPTSSALDWRRRAEGASCTRRARSGPSRSTPSFPGPYGSE